MGAPRVDERRVIPVVGLKILEREGLELVAGSP